MKTFIAIPAQNTIDTAFARCLTSLQLEGEVSINFSESSLVYDSRNKLATAAIKSGADYVLWLDTDMTFKPDMYKVMLDDISRGVDMVCGLFFARRPPYRPCIYKTIRQGLTPEENFSEQYLDYPKGELFPVDACGMAACLMKAEVLEKVISTYHEAFGPMRGYGEDISFCIRAKNLGFKLCCDSAILVGHMGMFEVNEAAFQQFRQAVETVEN